MSDFLAENAKNAAPAEMPGVEEIVRAMRTARLKATSAAPMLIGYSGLAPAEDADLASARAILALFAPILAEKSLHHVTGERITRKDLNNAHRMGREEGRLAAELLPALAKPASSPAGGGMDWKSLFETAHGALICVAEAQADALYARKVADELTDAALSQVPAIDVAQHLRDLEEAILACERGTMSDVLANYRTVRRTVQDLRALSQSTSAGRVGE